MLYDPQFYEYKALCFLATKVEKVIKINYRIPDYSVPISRRNELDGYIESENTPIEIKSYPLNEIEIDEILKRLNGLGYSRAIVITPKIIAKAPLKYNKHIEVIEFEPTDIDKIRATYQAISFQLPSLLERELLTGKHNFRFRLAMRGLDKQGRYLNQVDKKIDSLDKLKIEITRRLPEHNPPIKILWSTSRWLVPKDHFFRKRHNLYLGGPIVFDIDGPQLHKAFTSCVILPKKRHCEMCLFFAKRETKKLAPLLKDHGMNDVEIFFSGRSGFHIYVFDANREKLAMLPLEFMKHKIKVDQQVTLNIKSDIAFPLSINSFTGYRLAHIKEIDSFYPTHEY